MRNFGHHIATILILFIIICPAVRAQDSVRRATPPPAPPVVVRPQPGAAVNNPTLTVPPIILPLESQQPVKPRRRRLTTADSTRIAAQRDSIARAAAIVAAAALPAPNVANKTPLITPVVSPAVVVPPIDSTAIKAALALQAIPEVPILEKSDNPFDILRGAKMPIDSSVTTTQTMSPRVNNDAPSLLNKNTYSKNFLFWVFLILLVLTSLVISNARTAVQNAYQALLSDSSLRQIYREQLGWGNISQLALYGLFWLNAGLFIFLMSYRFMVKLPFSQFATLMLCIGGVSLAFIIKHAILYVIAAIFPINKDIKLYNYIIITGGILLSLILLPLNIFIAYSPEPLSEIFMYTAFGMILLVYIIRSLRSLSVATPYMMNDQFHFLLYLCAVEIAPIMILAKFLIDKSAFL